MRIKQLSTRAMALIATSLSTLAVAASLLENYASGRAVDSCPEGAASRLYLGQATRLGHVVCANAASVFVDCHRRRE